MANEQEKGERRKRRIWCRLKQKPQALQRLRLFLCLKDWKIFSDMDFSKLVGALSPVFMWLVMKKDSELPWVTRIARWVVLVFFTGYVAHCFKEWFL